MSEPFFARELAPVDAATKLANARLDVFMRGFEEAALACGLSFGELDSVRDCADAIVKAAKGAKLETRLYELAWFVRKTCTATQRE